MPRALERHPAGSSLPSFSPSALTDPNASAAQQAVLQQHLNSLTYSPFGDSPLFRNPMSDPKKKEEVRPGGAYPWEDGRGEKQEGWHRVGPPGNFLGVVGAVLAVVAFAQAGRDGTEAFPAHHGREPDVAGCKHHQCISLTPVPPF